MRKLVYEVWACLGFMVAAQPAMAGKNIIEAEVPPAVIAAFKAAYPNATGVEYEEETEHGAKVYEVEFKADGRKWEIDYSPDGKVIKTDQED
jgi:hypothetical protein